MKNILKVSAKMLSVCNVSCLYNLLEMECVSGVWSVYVEVVLQFVSSCDLCEL